MINYEALFKISYGLYIVCSGDKNYGNGFISNTVFQITADPATFAVSCNKNNYTAGIILKYGVFSVSILSVNASADIFGKFGYHTGQNFDKMAGTALKYGVTGAPIVISDSISALEFKLMETIDAGTHLIFIGELIAAEILEDTAEPMTYAYYRQVRKGMAPKNAPTYLDKSKLEKNHERPVFKKFECPVCGYIYDEELMEIKFKDLPDDWICPVCGTEKSLFIEILP